MANTNKQIRNIWMVSREYGDLAGAGGVKDVVYQLSKSLARWTGRSVHVVLPRYGFIDPGTEGFTPVADPLCPEKELQLGINMDLPHTSVKEQVRYYCKRDEMVNVYLVDSERFSEKEDIYTYTAGDESRSSWKKKSLGHYDFFAMNVLHQKAALELMIALSVQPDVIHCHDGHTALLPALIREKSGYSSYFRSSGCVVTVHNGGYGYHQEIDDLDYALSITGLPRRVILDNLLEARFDPLIVAGRYSVVTTVSENYARELQETDSDQLTGWLGHSLRSMGVVIQGVTNGIDPEAYAPATRAGGSKERYFEPGDMGDELQGKANCKAALLQELADETSLFPVEKYGDLGTGRDGVLFTFVGRLSEQKGVDVLLEVLPVLLGRHQGAQMLVLGSGSVELESRLMAFAGDPRVEGRMCYLKGYSPELANRIYGAGDFFVIPSRFEPCGLTDFIAQLHGNIPVVHQVGGLVKVKDGETGIGYWGGGPEDLLRAMERALALEPSTKRDLQYRAVKTIEQRYAWSKVMQNYIELYKQCHRTQLEYIADEN